MLIVAEPASWWKRQSDAIRALAQVYQRVPDAALVLGGSDTIGANGPSYQAELQQLAEELGVAHRVRFLGKVANAMSVIGSADVCPAVLGGGRPFQHGHGIYARGQAGRLHGRWRQRRAPSATGSMASSCGPATSMQ